MRINKELVHALAGKRLILFVGAGVSMSLDLPSWDQLMDHLARELGFAPEIFRGSANPMVLADYFMLEKGSLDPLLGWMDLEWHKDTTKINSSNAHDLITKLGFSLVYTTNYDRWLELAFQAAKISFTKITNIGDIQRIRDDETQIVKFHGDFDDGESIVLTESQYFKRLSFEHPLDVKLRADTLNRSVLFIGYSLSDINIRYLFYKLKEIWTAYDGIQERPQSYIFLTRPNLVQERVFKALGVTPIVSDSDDDSEGLVDFLQNLHDELYPRINPTGLLAPPGPREGEPYPTLADLPAAGFVD